MKKANMFLTDDAEVLDTNSVKKVATRFFLSSVRELNRLADGVPKMLRVNSLGMVIPLEKGLTNDQPGG